MRDLPDAAVTAGVAAIYDSDEDGRLHSTKLGELIVRRVLAAALPHLTAAAAAESATVERERIRQLAIELGASVCTPCPSPNGDEDCRCQERWFADLLDGDL